MADRPRPTPRPGASAPTSPPTPTPTGMHAGSRTAQQSGAEAGAQGEPGSQVYGPHGPMGAGAAAELGGTDSLLPLAEVFTLAQWAVSPPVDDADMTARRASVRATLWSIIDKTFPE